MSQPDMVRTIDGFAFSWPDLPIAIALSRIRESKSGTYAEMVVTLVNGTKPRTLAHRTLNLLTGKFGIIKELAARHEAPWDSMIEQLSVLSLRELRKGEPVETLAPTEQDAHAYFLLNPLLYDHNPTILYGPGDSMKSLFSLYCGLLLASGVCGPNLAVAPTPFNVLVLDWEMSAQDLRGRVKALQAGDPRLTGVPAYRRCTLPLADDLAEIKAVVSDGGYDVLILDSLAMAAGGQELEKAESAIRFNAALRALHCTSLIIGHTPKPQEGQMERTLYGSVFFQNLCRVSWECRREGDTLALYARKNNLGAKHHDLGFTFTMTDHACTVTEADLADDPILSMNLPLHLRIEALLKKGDVLTALAIANTLNAKLDSVRRSLQRHNGKKWVPLVATTGTEAEWTTL